jgi:hypothetical protein
MGFDGNALVDRCRLHQLLCPSARYPVVKGAFGVGSDAGGSRRSHDMKFMLDAGRGSQQFLNLLWRQVEVSSNEKRMTRSEGMSYQLIQHIDRGILVVSVSVKGDHVQRLDARKSEEP